MSKKLHITFCLMSAILWLACKNDTQLFTLKGTIKNAVGKTLYLEHTDVSKILVIDSLLLTSENFKFQQPRPEIPDFYRLRLDNQVINLAIDSTETIVIKSNAEYFSQNYVLEGTCAESQKIKELVILHTQTLQEYRDLQTAYKNGKVSEKQYFIELEILLEKYKNPAKTYILADFSSLSSYFALFQQIDNFLIFDVYEKADNKLFGAVANAWNLNYPESPRTEQLKNLFTHARVVMRGEQTSLPAISEADSKVFFDLSLPSLQEKEIRLSEIATGKLVLIDFTAYSDASSPEHNTELLKIYRKYHTQGLEIYQIALDTDEHLWKNAAVNLPWICVRDLQSTYSPNLQKYNVREIPTTFLMDRSGEIVLKMNDLQNPEKDLIKYLK